MNFALARFSLLISALASLVACAVVDLRTPCCDYRLREETAASLFSDPGARKLAEAACNGQSREVAKLAAAGIDPNARGKNGETPLHWALSCRSLAGVEALLKVGGDPNHQDDFFITPVAAAATVDEPEYLEAFLKAGGDPAYSIYEQYKRASVADYNNNMIPNMVSYGHIITDAIHTGFTDSSGRDAEPGWQHLELLIAYGADLNTNLNSRARSEEQVSTMATRLIMMNRACKALELMQRGLDRNLPGLRSFAKTSQSPSASENGRCNSEIIRIVDEQFGPAPEPLEPVTPPGPYIPKAR
ncbi:MAG: ankyrin repeat domain-containing protein [Hyphomonas sp.]